MGMQEFWQLNTLPLGIVLFMFIFVFNNRTFEADLTNRMLIPIIGLLIVINLQRKTHMLACGMKVA